MQVFHELGHVLGAYLTGGKIEKVYLHPLSVSMTGLSHNPHPFFVVWAGPFFGSLFGLVICAAARILRLPGRYMFRFLAGFCLIANGFYIGLGSIQGLGDAQDMSRMGSPLWVMVLFGAAASSLGFALWHGIGEKFGLGKSRGEVDGKAAMVSIGLFTAIVFSEAIYNIFF